MYTLVLSVHILSMVVVLGGYIFLSFFWWPVLRHATADIRVQVHYIGQTLRRFFTAVLLALTIALMTGGLYLLPVMRQVSDSARLPTFYTVLGIKLAAVFLVMILVPMQLFGMAFRLTRMDAGIYPYDAEIVQRVGKRLHTVSYCIIFLLTGVLVLSTWL